MRSPTPLVIHCMLLIYSVSVFLCLYINSKQPRRRPYYTYHRSSIIHIHIQPPLPTRSNLTHNQHNLSEQLKMSAYGRPYGGGADGDGLYGGGAYSDGPCGGQNEGPFRSPKCGYQMANPQSAGQGPASGQQFGGGNNPSNNYNPLNLEPQ